MITLQSAVNDWLSVIKRAKSPRTYITYKSSASIFMASIRSSLSPRSPVGQLDESHFGEFLQSLKYGSPRTEKHHATIMTLFFEYLSAKRIAEINMDSIRFMRRNETRKVPQRLRKMDFAAVAMIAAAVSKIEPVKGDVITARAKALVLLMAESGLRAFETISLRTIDLDFEKRRGVVIGKGNKQALFVLGTETIKAIRSYHTARKVRSEWVFVSHSNRSRNVTPIIDIGTVRHDVKRICDLILTEAPEYRITPHQFRHLFATEVWRETGDIVQAQTALRHGNIATTQGYVHTGEEDLQKLEDSLRKARQSGL